MLGFNIEWGKGGKTCQNSDPTLLSGIVGDVEVDPTILTFITILTVGKERPPTENQVIH